MSTFSFLYLLHLPIHHQPFTMDNGLNTWARLLDVIHKQALCFPTRVKIYCLFLKCSDRNQRRNALTFNLRCPPPSIGNFPILDRWGKDECLQHLHTSAKVCTCSQFPIPTNSITFSMTISISSALPELVNVPDLVRKTVVVDTVIDSFVTVLDLLVEE